MTKQNQPTSTRLAISLPEAATVLGVSRYLLTKQIRDGVLHYKRMGRRLLLPMDELKQWLAGRTP